MTLRFMSAETYAAAMAAAAAAEASEEEEGEDDAGVVVAGGASPTRGRKSTVAAHRIDGADANSSGTYRGGVARGAATSDFPSAAAAAVVRHGEGHMTYDSGITYQGAWCDDVWHGRGTLTLVDGTTFTGDFAGGTIHGGGVMTWPVDGDGADEAAEANAAAAALLDPTVPVDCSGWKMARCSSGWLHGVPEGEGEVVFSNGAVYTGSLVEGRIQGAGAMALEATVAGVPTRVHASGTWAGGVLHGAPCVIHLVHGAWSETYTGGVEAGVRSGSAVVAGRDGSHFEGGYRGGKRNGHGLLRAADLSTYDGKFVGGERCGWGVSVAANGDVTRGMWSGDAPVPGKVALLPKGTGVPARV